MITYNNTRSITNKWPGMIVVGDNVTPEQAAEILLRTDLRLPNFKNACNDTEFCEQVQEIFGNCWEDFSFNTILESIKRFKKLNLSYLYNERIASSWIGGAHGWCNWDGTIGSRNYNIGKWPSVKEVAEDWEQIAEAFPFLNLRCQLFTGETGQEDNKPNILFIVKDGKVVVEDSDEPIGSFEEPDFMTIHGLGLERGITIPKLKEKVRMVYGEI